MNMIKHNIIGMILQAHGETDKKFCGFLGTATLTAAAGESGKSSSVKFQMDLYNGGPMSFYWSEIPVVVDLAGMKTNDKSPAFRSHNPEKIVGHTTRVWIESGSQLKVEGIISGGNSYSQEIIDSSSNGFPWQASMGAEIISIEQIKAGESVEVNGQQFQGPLLVVRTSQLMEASFVPIGADNTTIAQLIAASRSTTTPVSGTAHKEIDMKFAEWLKAQGWTDAEITDLEAKKESSLYKTLQASWKKEHQPEPAKKTDGEGGNILTAGADHESYIAAGRKAAADETRRISEIRKVCAGQHADIEAEAIEKGWSSQTAELHVLRAARAQGGPAAGHTARPIGQKVLEAASIMFSGHDDEMLKSYDEKTLEAASNISRDFGGFNLSALFLSAARSNGYAGHSTKVNREVLQAAFGMVNAGFSNIDIGGILSNIANKFMLSGFMSVEQGWQRIADIKTATDFKTMHRYRLIGDAEFEKVSNGGEIAAGDLGQLAYQNKVDTFAKLFSISRQDFINDDLNALSDVPRKIGRGGALKVNSVFWTEWLDDASFFENAKGNYIVGATSALSMEGLKRSISKFRRQTDPKGKPLGLTPRILIVPPELEAAALELTRSVSVNTGGAATDRQVPNANIYTGRFEVVISSYLTAVNAWYLAASPLDLAAIEVAFLNGQRRPFIEQADADFSTLGVQMRGYYDFGVAKQEYRAALKSKGEA